MKHLLLLTLVVVVLLLPAGALGAMEEIHNAEFFDEIRLHETGDERVRAAAFLAIYRPGACMQKLHKLGYSDQGLPQGQEYVVVGRFDAQTRPKEAWYQWDEDFDLAGRYDWNAEDCPRIMFFPRGRNEVPLPPVTWNKQGSFSDWAWDQLRVELSVTNPLDRAVTVNWVDQTGNLEPVVQIEPGATTVVNSLISHQLVVTDAASGDFINGIDVRLPADVKIAARDDGIASAEAWRQHIAAESRKTRELLDAMIWSHRRRHLLAIKQPMIVEGYTQTGFKKARIPDDLYEEIHTWYKNNRDRLLQVENWPKGATQINFDYVQTAMVHLPHAMKKRIADRMQALLEEWSGQKLEYQMMYGIREYYDGSILKNHVDRVESHVVSAILQIDQDVDDDWPLEVIRMDTGEKVRIAMEPGDMVFYESARLIHGRPSAVKGKFYANAFLHFRPLQWAGQYQFTPDNVIIAAGQRVPLVPYEIFGTPYKQAYTRDEL